MKLYHSILGIAAFSGAIFLNSCESKTETEVVVEEPIDDTFAVTTEKMKIKVDTLYTGFEHPWGMTWLPDGKLLVTEKEGDILVFENDKFTGTKIEGLPTVYKEGQSGLLDIEVHPDYSSNGWIYISYGKAKEDEKSATTIARFKLDGSKAVELEELWEATPAWKGGNHFGSRIIFDKDNYMYFSSGDRFDTKMNAQTLENAHGKIHRLKDDGSVPEDNPYVNEPNAVKSIWVLGNRNPQGLVYDAANDRVWESEHGPMGGDELNLIEKGKNYGWPVITYGTNYDGSTITEITEKEGMEQPVSYYVPSIATAGIAIVTSDKYPAWKGDILIGALAKMHINRVDMDGDKALSQEIMLQDIGRVRQISESPDGYLYAITEGTGLLVKLIPIL